MPAVQRFPRRDHRGRLRPGLLLTPERLTVWHGRKSRAVLWPEVLCVRWRDPEHAELVLLTDATVAIEGVDGLDVAVAARDERVRGARLAAADAAALPRCLTEQLLKPRPWSWGQWLQSVLIFAAGTFALSFFLASDHRTEAVWPWRWWLTAAAGAIGGAIGWFEPFASAFVNARGVGSSSRHCPWQDVIRLATCHPVSVAKDLVVYDVDLETAHGLVKIRVGGKGDVDLIEQFLRWRERWRSTAYTPAGPLPPPDNALSLARETGQEATDRGLSLTEGHGER